MKRRYLELASLTATVAALTAIIHVVPQPASVQVSAAEPTATKTPWGEPDLQGIWTVERLVPLERPDGVTKPFYTDEEVSRLDRERSGKSVFGNGVREERGSEADVAGAYNSVFTSQRRTGRRTGMITDPPDGKIPPPTADARRRASARTEARRGRGEADSWEDRSMFDRCISRGVPNSMMPTIYGNSYQIQQGPGVVAIMYEMIHEARVIPLGNQPHVGSAIRSYMGDARGHFEGDTLVVETRGFNDKLPYRGSSPDLVLVERFTRVAPDKVEWSVTFNDPATWARPWTFGMHLTKVRDEEGPFEYACHEGNYAMFNLLKIAREEEQAAGAAAAAGAAPRQR